MQTAKGDCKKSAKSVVFQYLFFDNCITDYY